MKSFKLFAALTLLFVSLGVQAQRYSNEKDEFPSDAYWLNTDFPLSFKTFENKALVIAVWNQNDPMGLMMAHQLETFTKQNPNFQLVSIIPGDSLNPSSVGDYNHFIQLNKFTHPLGIVKNLDSFSTVRKQKETKPEQVLPGVFVYEKSNKPSKTFFGVDIVSVLANLQTMAQAPGFATQFSNFQIMPMIAPNYWADPIIEAPRYITRDGDMLYISEPAHDRIIEMDVNGNVVTIIGASICGFNDGVAPMAWFNNPGGTAFDAATNKLYIADTDNHFIRVYDKETSEVTTLSGTGQLTDDSKEPKNIGLPTDVVVHEGKLFVVSAFSNELIELDKANGKIKSRRSLTSASRPVNLSSSPKGILIVMNDGSVWMVGKKDITSVYSPATHKDKASACDMYQEKMYVLLPYKHQLLVQENTTWKVVAGSEKGYQNGPLNQAKFNHPFDLVRGGGGWIISDSYNDCVRLINGDKAMAIRPEPKAIIMAGAESPELSDPLVVDLLTVGKGRNAINVQLDVPGYQLAVDGRNEVMVIEEYGLEPSVSNVTDYGFTVDFNTIATYGMLQVGVYLTLENKEHPEQVIYKKAYLNVPYEVVDDAVKRHDLLISPRLLPQ